MRSNIVCFGEVLWDNIPGGRRIGGAPLNVCYHLNKLGIHSRVISQIGADEDGEALLGELKKLGVEVDFCGVSSSKRTSVVEVVIAENGDISYDIVEDVAWDHIHPTPEMESLVKDATGLVFGSLVARSDVSRDTLFRLLELSSFNIFDVNLRYPFYTKDLVFSLLSHTDLLKLNEHEVIVISDWLIVNSSDLNQRVRHISRHFPNINEIILTRGSLGATYYNGKESFGVDPYPVEVKDTIGSGDAFLAGFLAAKLKGKSINECLEQASLLAAFIAGERGACPEYDRSTLGNLQQNL